MVTRQDFRSMNEGGPGRSTVMECGCVDNAPSNPDPNLGRVSSCVPGARHRISGVNLERLEIQPLRFSFLARGSPSHTSPPRLIDPENGWSVGCL